MGRRISVLKIQERNKYRYFTVNEKAEVSVFETRVAADGTDASLASREHSALSLPVCTTLASAVSAFSSGGAALFL